MSTTSANSCGDCPLKPKINPETGKRESRGCYAFNYPLRHHWAAVSRFERGFSLEEFAKGIQKLPYGQVWRHNQAGDLPRRVKKLCRNDRSLRGVSTGMLQNIIDWAQLKVIVSANFGRKGFTYTHHDPTIPENMAAIKTANDGGFTINLSADNLTEADKFKAVSIAPVTVVLPKNQTTNLKTPAGTNRGHC